MAGLRNTRDHVSGLECAYREYRLRIPVASISDPTTMTTTTTATNATTATAATATTITTTTTSATAAASATVATSPATTTGSITTTAAATTASASSATSPPGLRRWYVSREEAVSAGCRGPQMTETDVLAPMNSLFAYFVWFSVCSALNLVVADS